MAGYSARQSSYTDGDVITAAQLSSTPPGPSVAIGMLSQLPLTHFSVLVSASSPQSVGKPKNSHDTV